MKLHRAAGPHPALFNLVPALNVVFLLLVFFALSSTFISQPGIPISLPLSSVTLAPQHNPRVVSITATPIPEIYFQDQKVTLENLGRLLNGGRGSERTLIIRADRDVPYNVVMQVTNLGLQAGYSVVLAAQEHK